MILNYITWNPSPEIFTIPGIDWPVRWYGLSWAFAFIGSHFIMNKIFKKELRTEKQLDKLTVYILVATIVGARLGHCLFYGFKDYMAHPLDILKVYEGGLASHGGAIGILIGMWLYCRKTKESWLWLFDRLVVAVPFASMSIRIGNLMNSEIVGKVTDVAWAFKFMNCDEDKSNYYELGIDVPARHPAQLYEAIFYLALFGLMFFLWKTKREQFGKGFMFGLFCVLMFTQRFFIEFVKENQEAFEGGMALNMGQILSLPFIVIGLVFMLRANKLGGYGEKIDSSITSTN